MLAVTTNGLDAHVPGLLAQARVFEQIRVAQDRGHGRADLVTHGGKELRLRAVGLLRLIRERVGLLGGHTQLRRARIHLAFERALILLHLMPGLGQALDHDVERVREIFYLVVRGDFDLTIEPAIRDLSRELGELSDGGGDAPGHEHGQRDAEKDHQRREDRGEEHELFLVPA